MDPQDILTLAQQGDPKIIEALINHTTQPRGIMARVRRREACLHVLLESSKVLNQQASVAFVRKRLESLNVEPIATVKIYGRQTGQKEFVWNQEIPLILHTELLDSSSEEHSPISVPDEQPSPPPANTVTDLDPELHDQGIEDQSLEPHVFAGEPQSSSQSEDMAPRDAIQHAKSEESATLDHSSSPERTEEPAVESETVEEPDAEVITPEPDARVDEPDPDLPVAAIHAEEKISSEKSLAPQERQPDLVVSSTATLVTTSDEEAVLVDAVLVEEEVDWDSEDEMVLFSGDRLVQTISEILQRPEAIIFLVFVAFVMVWDLYLDLMTQAAENGISGRELARRLGVNHSTISRRKDREDFSAWSQTLDPDGVAWIYENGGFMPQFETVE